MFEKREVGKVREKYFKSNVSRQNKFQNGSVFGF